MVICSISESADSADQPQSLVGNSDLPPGLGPHKQHPTEAVGLPGTAGVSHAAISNAAASDSITSAADTLQNSGAAGPPTSQDTEKQLRNLRKKIRQADAMASKAAAGHPLTPEEEEKLRKLASWYELIFAEYSDNSAAYASLGLGLQALCCILVQHSLYPSFWLLVCINVVLGSMYPDVLLCTSAILQQPANCC